MSAPLTRTEASAAVESIGWRLLLSALHASVSVDSLRRAAEVTGRVIEACGTEADDHLRVDARPDRVDLALQTRTTARVTATDVELARRVTTALDELGVSIAAPTSSAGRRPVQRLEVAIDTMDATVIRPFWKAVLAYGDDVSDDPPNGVADPTGEGPSIWFQQLAEARPIRNRIHFDITVAHDEAEGRIRAALDAGGVLVSDADARAFWILADADGNEICICTWQDRDRA